MDGGTSFQAPVKVAAFYDVPECAPGDGSAGALFNRGGTCLGTADVNGGTDRSHFRASNYPSGVVDPNDPNTIYVHVGSYVNVLSHETAGSRTPAGVDPVTGNNRFAGSCRNHILQSISTNGGLSFDGTELDPRDLPVVDGDGPNAHQWFQWTAAAPNGRIDVSFYHRQLGDCDVTGCQDVSLASLGPTNRSDSALQPTANRRRTLTPPGLSGVRAGGVTNGSRAWFTVKRVTTSSMPPPTQFGGTFMGDYMALASANEAAYPLWTDTRRLDKQRDDAPQPGTPSGVPLNDQDATTAVVRPDVHP
jgi:hypothetical protein